MHTIIVADSALSGTSQLMPDMGGQGRDLHLLLLTILKPEISHHGSAPPLISSSLSGRPIQSSRRLFRPSVYGRQTMMPNTVTPPAGSISSSVPLWCLFRNQRAEGLGIGKSAWSHGNCPVFSIISEGEKPFVHCCIEP